MSFILQLSPENSSNELPVCFIVTVADNQPTKSLVIDKSTLLALEDDDGSPSFLEKALRFIEQYGKILDLYCSEFHLVVYHDDLYEFLIKLVSFY